MNQDESWHAGRPPPWPHCVIDGDPAHPPPKGQSPQFSAHICCGEMAGWIKMPLGMEVGLGPGDFMLDVDYAPQNGGGAAPTFGSCGQTAAWIKLALGMEVGLFPRPHCAREGASYPPPKWWQRPPNFRSMSIGVRCLDGSICHLVRRQACLRKVRISSETEM